MSPPPLVISPPWGSPPSSDVCAHEAEAHGVAVIGFLAFDAFKNALADEEGNISGPKTVLAESVQV